MIYRSFTDVNTVKGILKTIRILKKSWFFILRQCYSEKVLPLKAFYKF